MSVASSPTQIEVKTDSLTDKVREAIADVENLRAAKIRLAEQINRKLAEQVKSLKHAKLVPKSEVESLRLAVEDERAERRHYHSLADEIITRLNVVRQTIGDVVKRAGKSSGSETSLRMPGRDCQEFGAALAVKQALPSAQPGVRRSCGT
jgi:hypothetical protein